MGTSKYVKLEILNTAAFSSLVNIEKMLSNAKTSSAGIYLPAKRLQDHTSSLVFVPTHTQTTGSQLGACFQYPQGQTLSEVQGKCIPLTDDKATSQTHQQESSTGAHGAPAAQDPSRTLIQPAGDYVPPETAKEAIEADDFEACVKAVMANGKDETSAKNICENMRNKIFGYSLSVPINREIEPADALKKRNLAFAAAISNISKSKETLEAIQKELDTATTKSSKQAFRTTTETNPNELESKDPTGLLITPPGLALSKLFEKELKKPFTEASLEDLQTQLPKLFDDLQITKHLNIQPENNNITVTIRNHVFEDLCKETAKLELTHKIIGCPLSSALACAFAKATGRPITIEAEETSLHKTTTIHYKILEN
jgi:hypothetical protein